MLECVLRVTCPAETWPAARGLLSSHHTLALQPVCLLLPSLLLSTCVVQGTRALIPYKLLYLAVTGLTPVTIPVFEQSQASTELVCPWLTTSSWPVYMHVIFILIKIPFILICYLTSLMSFQSLDLFGFLKTFPLFISNSF